MAADEAIQRIYAASVRLTPDAIDFLKANENADFIADKIIAIGSPIITKEDIDNLLKQEEKIPMPVEVIRQSGFSPIAADHPTRLEVLTDQDVSGKSRCTGSLENFVEYFRDRFTRSSGMLRVRMLGKAPIPLNRLKEHKNESGWFIGMVSDKRITKNEHLLIEVEDEHGTANIFVSKNERKLMEYGKRVLLDDVIAIEGKIGDDAFIIATDIIWPDMPFGRDQKLCESDVATVYLSDIHIGSKYFLEKEFSKFINWLNGNEREKEIAGKVKYIIVAGDLVDGIGIYPNQEKELVVKDIYKQYEMFDSLIQSIPDYIEVIVAPGNHDAVRRGEPQPRLPKDVIKSDVTSIGSPSYVKIEGIKHLIYHGTSLDSIIANMSGLDYSKPEFVMLELLKRRHLSPIYGENPIIPEGRDYMLIDEEPDVVHMGHIHKNGNLMYRGTMLVNSGTFQSRTDFQVKMGHVPSPGLVPVYEMKTGKLSQINFGIEG